MKILQFQPCRTLSVLNDWVWGPPQYWTYILSSSHTYVGLGRFVPETNSTMYRTSYPDIKVHAYKISLVVACFAISFAYPIPKFIFLEFRRNISIINICCWYYSWGDEDAANSCLETCKKSSNDAYFFFACGVYRHASKCVGKRSNIMWCLFPPDGILLRREWKKCTSL